MIKKGAIISSGQGAFAAPMDRTAIQIYFSSGTASKIVLSSGAQSYQLSNFQVEIQRSEKLLKILADVTTNIFPSIQPFT